MSDYEQLQQRLDSELEEWRFLPGTGGSYVVGVDEDWRIQVYSLKNGVKCLSQHKRRRRYYVRMTLDGKRRWRSVKKLYRSIWPRDSIFPPVNFEKRPSKRERLASLYDLEQVLDDGEEWGYALAQGRVVELRQYAVTTSGRVFNLKGSEVTEVSQTVDDNGARVRLYFDGKVERPYVHSLMADVFGTDKVYDPRVSRGDRRGLTKKIGYLEYCAHLSIYEDGRERNWYGERRAFVEKFGEKAVRQAEAKKPQFTGPAGY